MPEQVGGCPVHRSGLLFWLPFAATAVLVAAALFIVEMTTWYFAAGVLTIAAMVSLPIAIYHPACRYANARHGYGTHDHKETP